MQLSASLTTHNALLRLLLCHQVATAGLLNIIGAPHLGDDSTYRAMYVPRPVVLTLASTQSQDMVKTAMASLAAIGYPAKVS